MLRGSSGGEVFCRSSRLESGQVPREKRREERFLSAQADRFAGAKRKEKASACAVRNDVWGKAREGRLVRNEAWCGSGGERRRRGRLWWRLRRMGRWGGWMRGMASPMGVG